MLSATGDDIYFEKCFRSRFDAKNVRSCRYLHICDNAMFTIFQGVETFFCENLNFLDVENFNDFKILRKLLIVE